MRAMAIASDYFKSIGFFVEDVSVNHSYDLKCTKGDNELFIEVKGTTSQGQQIILTKNEVRFARDNVSNYVLFVVKNIICQKDGNTWKAEGGESILHDSWSPRDEFLNPIAFRYDLGSEIENSKYNY